MKCSENTSYSARTATITVTPGAGTATPPSWTLTQAGATPPVEKRYVVVSVTWKDGFGKWAWPLASIEDYDNNFYVFASWGNDFSVDGIADGTFSDRFYVSIDDVLNASFISMRLNVDPPIDPAGGIDEEPYYVKFKLTSNNNGVINTEERDTTWYFDDSASTEYNDEFDIKDFLQGCIIGEGDLKFDIEISKPDRY